jgi:predicted Fe-S protein YdhL (DUF1289 family)
MTSVASPCKNICRMHEPSGQCVGCGRTLDEIALWSVLDDDDKRSIWALLPARLAALPAAEGDGEVSGPRPPAAR